VIAFGPVPSRRLGRSLGINNIPPKECTYSCVYCQVGRTLRMGLERHAFHDVEELVSEVASKVEAAARAGEEVDYLTFVPDGEPTLDENLGRAIEGVKGLGLPVAVITNGSLLWREDVRAELSQADWVSVKVDAVREERWKTVNRPHGRLELEAVLEGMKEFAEGFGGTLATETMLLDGMNDGENELRDTARFVGSELGAWGAYLSVPTRPPAESWAEPAREDALARAYEVFRAWEPRVALLMGYEGDAFASTGDAREDLLSITAVHPMRETAVRRLLERAGEDWALVEELITRGDLVEVRYGSDRYLLRPVAPRGAA